MDFWLIAYIVISIVIGTGTSGFLYKRQQTVAAILCFILLVLIFVFYGLRWFSGGNLKGSQTGTVAWPPIVNVCPDFMISYKANGKTYCYDVNNTYGLKTAAAITGIADASVINTTDTGFVLISDSNLKREKLSDDVAATSKKWPLLTQFETDPSTILKANANTGYLRWEGVWDGRNATATKLQPLPS